MTPDEEKYLSKEFYVAGPLNHVRAQRDYDPNMVGYYEWPDGARIWPMYQDKQGRWRGAWANGVMMRGDDQGGESISVFDTAVDAAKALAAGGEGPASVSGWAETYAARAVSDRDVVDRTNDIAWHLYRQQGVEICEGTDSIEPVPRSNFAVGMQPVLPSCRCCRLMRTSASRTSESGMNRPKPGRRKRKMIARGHAQPPPDKPKAEAAKESWWAPGERMRPRSFPFSFEEHIYNLRRTPSILGHAGALAVPAAAELPKGTLPPCSKCGAPEMTAALYGVPGATDNSPIYGCLCGNFIRADGTPLNQPRPQQ